MAKLFKKRCNTNYEIISFPCSYLSFPYPEIQGYF
jgi:hypothetical protein